MRIGGVVSALLKVENLKANHNELLQGCALPFVVSALLKVENLKANHNSILRIRLCVKLYLLYLK